MPSPLRSPHTSTRGGAWTSLAQLQSVCSDIDEDVYPVLQLEYGVDKRNILGGTSAETVTKALYEELEKLDKLG